MKTTTDAAADRFFRTAATLIAAQVVLYFFFGWLLPFVPGKDAWHQREIYFGLSQLRLLPVLPALAWAAVIAGAAAWYHRAPARIDSLLERLEASYRARARYAVLTGLVAALVFWLLRSRFINMDARTFPFNFSRGVAAFGAFTSLDEIGELWVHSALWGFGHERFGWTIAGVYQVVSSLAGGGFVVLLVALCSRLVPGRGLIAAALILCGGYAQLFFGDIENYTLTALLVLLYFYASARHLDTNRHLAWPAVCLSLAIVFHGLAAFMGPSLLYLFVRAARQDRGREIGPALLAFAAPIGAALFLVHVAYMPLGEFIEGSHGVAALGGSAAKFVRPSLDYYLQLGNLLLLLMPALPLLILAAGTRRLRRDPVGVHLVIASLTMLVYVLTWRAALGIHHDWNLFAVAAIPWSLLLWTSLLRGPAPPARARVLSTAFGLFSLVSLAWILANHAPPP